MALITASVLIALATGAPKHRRASHGQSWALCTSRFFSVLRHLHLPSPSSSSCSSLASLCPLSSPPHDLLKLCRPASLMAATGLIPGESFLLPLLALWPCPLTRPLVPPPCSPTTPPSASSVLTGTTWAMRPPPPLLCNSGGNDGMQPRAPLRRHHCPAPPSRSFTSPSSRLPALPPSPSPALLPLPLPALWPRLRSQRACSKLQRQRRNCHAAYQVRSVLPRTSHSPAVPSLPSPMFTRTAWATHPQPPVAPTTTAYCPAIAI